MPEFLKHFCQVMLWCPEVAVSPPAVVSALCERIAVPNVCRQVCGHQGHHQRLQGRHGGQVRRPARDGILHGELVATLPLLSAAPPSHSAGYWFLLCIWITMLLLLDTCCTWREPVSNRTFVNAKVGDIKEVQEKADKMVRCAMCSRALPCTSHHGQRLLHAIAGASCGPSGLTAVSPLCRRVTWPRTSDPDGKAAARHCFLLLMAVCQGPRSRQRHCCHGMCNVDWGRLAITV